MQEMIKTYLKRNLTSTRQKQLKNIASNFTMISMVSFLTFIAKIIFNPINFIRFAFRDSRCLEIGPGYERIKNFEGVNIVWNKNTHHIYDVSKKLPFKDETFRIIYASHVLEHIPWYQVENTLREWVRILKTGGMIEIWVPNGLLIAETFVKGESFDPSVIEQDGWYKFNEDRDPCKWMNGRTFSYGNGFGKRGHQNWHLGLFSPRYLEKVMQNAGLSRIETLVSDDVRAYDHGWINLGRRGSKL